MQAKPSFVLSSRLDSFSLGSTFTLQLHFIQFPRIGPQREAMRAMEEEELFLFFFPKHRNHLLYTIWDEDEDRSRGWPGLDDNALLTHVSQDRGQAKPDHVLHRLLCLGW